MFYTWTRFKMVLDGLLGPIACSNAASDARVGLCEDYPDRIQARAGHWSEGGFSWTSPSDMRFYLKAKAEAYGGSSLFTQEYSTRPVQGATSPAAHHDDILELRFRGQVPSSRVREAITSDSEWGVRNASQCARDMSSLNIHARSCLFMLIEGSSYTPRFHRNTSLPNKISKAKWVGVVVTGSPIQMRNLPRIQADSSFLQQASIG